MNYDLDVRLFESLGDKREKFRKKMSSLDLAWHGDGDEIRLAVLPEAPRIMGLPSDFPYKLPAISASMDLQVKYIEAMGWTWGRETDLRYGSYYTLLGVTDNYQTASFPSLLAACEWICENAKKEK